MPSLRRDAFLGVSSLLLIASLFSIHSIALGLFPLIIYVCWYLPSRPLGRVVLLTASLLLAVEAYAFHSATHDCAEVSEVARFFNSYAGAP
jgi:hypothetical protein